MSDSSDDDDDGSDFGDQSGTDCESHGDTYDDSDMSTLLDWNGGSDWDALAGRFSLASTGGRSAPIRKKQSQRVQYQQQANHSVASPPTADIPELYLVDSQGNSRRYRLVPAEVEPCQEVKDPRQGLEYVEDSMNQSSQQSQVPRRHIHPRYFEGSIISTIESMEDSSEIRSAEYVIFFTSMLVVLVFVMVGFSTRLFLLPMP
ncbi:hypothetical protein CSAL01_03273 [Colletotrichum salicis]|uniref:Uncharacterized protein n=1 Tax=Colletotrichum salicis TaxID=1209931 RepID=A0A135TGN6_9PEZI|nr:hypothetical protein CSAL01_03273 [Colletotrichum salicis]